MTTTEEAALDLCGLIGVEELALAGTPTLNRIISDINAELQYLWTLIPHWWSAEPTGAIVRAPQTLSGITATFGSKTVTLTAPDTWMVGCTLLFDGEEFQNQLVAYTGTTGTLLRPYAGATGSGKSAILYNDCFVQATTTSAILPPVLLLGEGELIGLSGRRDLRRYSSNSTYATNHGLAGDMGAAAENMDIGRPIAYYVETYSNPTTRLTNLRLRLAPLPDKQYLLEYQSRTEAPRITTLNSSTSIPVPQQYVDSVFMPMLRKRFASWKNFNTQGIKGVLDEQYNQAIQILDRLKPQPIAARSVGVRPGW